MNKTDKARQFLKEFQKEYFLDRTFNDYIDKHLAGDFAYHMAMAIGGIQEKCIICGEYDRGGNGMCDFCEGNSQ